MPKVQTQRANELLPPRCAGQLVVGLELQTRRQFACGVLPRVCSRPFNDQPDQLADDSRDSGPKRRNARRREEKLDGPAAVRRLDLDRPFGR